ncbi:hypothetical protein P886_0345 [Alteromonadaceae bacterium 2753L.S.0a.02]|nr:hypothetical protein P886_0345 [Alteromonadaceae bacterium 2753L.S.0a.02]
MNERYQGSCHCGNVSFEIIADLNSVFICNCSFCIRRSATLVKTTKENFTLNSDENNLKSYGNNGVSRHYFCPDCGIHCFTKITKEGSESVVSNVGCLEGANVLELKPSLFDGANKL